MVRSDVVLFFNFEIMDSKGNLLESSYGKPNAIISGRNQAFPRIEKALERLSVGESKRIAVPCKEGYGEYDSNLVIQIHRSQLIGQPKIGGNYSVEVDQGSTLDMRLVDDKNDILILDGNHPYAGIDLLIKLILTQKRVATTRETKTGEIQQNHSANN